MLKSTCWILALALAPLASARPFCSVRDARGTYAFLGNGLVLVPNTPITGPFLRVGTVQLDGAGGAVADTLAIYNGINFGPEHFPGTYTVSPDCTIDFHMAVPAPIFANVEFKGQVSEDGDSFTFMLVNTSSPQAPPITTVAGFGRKRSLNRCSADDLQGSWRYELNGVKNLPPFGGGTQFRQIALVEADGKNVLRLSLITSNNGVIAQDSVVGNYTVSADCAFDMNFSVAGAPTSIRGSLIGHGEEAFVALDLPGITVPNVGIVNGAVATGSMNRQSNSHGDH